MDTQFIDITIEQKDGRMIAVASDETIDRDGQSIKIGSWDLGNFKKNPVIQFGHRYDVPPIGVARKIWVEGRKLLFEPVFHKITELSRDIAAMYEQGFMNSFSVGFMAKEKSNELVEISAVPIPANPNAIVLSKSLEQPVTEEVQTEIKAWIETEAPVVEDTEITEGPDVIETKAGRILSEKNRGSIKDVISILQDILASQDIAETPKENKDVEDITTGDTQQKETAKSVVVRLKKVVRKDPSEQIIERALQISAGQLNRALQLVKERKNNG